MDDTVEEQLIALLRSDMFPSWLHLYDTFFRTHDDCDGDMSEGVGVTVGGDGDVWLTMHNARSHSCRFRMPVIGGGQSPCTRNALLILALAIKLDAAHKQGVVKAGH